MAPSCLGSVQQHVVQTGQCIALSALVQAWQMSPPGQAGYKGGGEVLLCEDHASSLRLLPLKSHACPTEDGGYS